MVGALAGCSNRLYPHLAGGAPRGEPETPPPSVQAEGGAFTHAALDRAQTFARRFPYVLQCDVEQFFPAIDHAILRETLSRKIRDPRVLWLSDRDLDQPAKARAHFEKVGGARNARDTAQALRALRA